jgi:hypothetical protein
MARAALFAALLLVGLASCSAFDLSEFPSEVLDFVKDKVGLNACCCAADDALLWTPTWHVSAFDVARRVEAGYNTLWCLNEFL